MMYIGFAIAIIAALVCFTISCWVLAHPNWQGLCPNATPKQARIIKAIDVIAITLFIVAVLAQAALEYAM